MDPTIVLDASDRLISNGVAGVLAAAVLALIWFVLMLRAELRDVRLAHKVEIAEKDSIILDLQEKRLVENKVGFEIAKSTQSTLDAFLNAIRGRSS